MAKTAEKTGTENTIIKSAPASRFYVVAIGASAGGLEAIHAFFDHLPDAQNLSFIVIQHLSPDHKSLLVELVSRHTHMQVLEAGQNMLIKEGCVYIIPNDKLITVSSGQIKLGEKVKGKAPNTAINTCMQSLAHDFGQNAVAIILSGTGTDGTNGAREINERGGMVMVQDPEDAKFDGMPQSAIASGMANIVTTPEKMPAKLLEYIRQPDKHIPANGEIGPAHMAQLLKLVQESSGFDFTQYKPATLNRRVLKHMAMEKVDSPEEYLARMKASPAMVSFISRDFLINYTQFFRDAAAFALLEKKVLPAIAKEKEEGAVIKIWACAVSTGEEAYSLAIIADRFLKSTGKKCGVKIFATDINARDLEQAAKNQFPLSVKKHIAPDLLEEYFVKGSSTYSVVPHIRKMLVFARQDILSDPPFIKNDLVVCRNMMIYLNTALQDKVLATLHFSLLKAGFLFLGTSETARHIKADIEEVSTKWKIYRKKGLISFPRDAINSTEKTKKEQPVKTTPRENAEKAHRSPVLTDADALRNDFQESLMNDLGFTAYFVDHNFEIRQTLGDFNRFLKLPQKQLNLNIVKMVPPGLGVLLNRALRTCAKEGRPVPLQPVRIKEGDKDIVLNVVVKPATVSGYLLVLIGIDMNRATTGGGAEEKTPAKEAPVQPGYVTDLEDELDNARRKLQTLSEQMEISNEELQSSNEELLSGNEELQSSNEELQSLNEELHTLNTEHQLKITELVHLNDDLNNYFRSTDIGQIFLDSRFQIRKFNPAAVKLFNLIEADIGRPIDHISDNLKKEGLHDDIREVMHHQQMVQREVQLKNGKSSLVRMMPYIRADKKTDGIVISFVDITAVTRLNDLLTGVFNSSVNAIMAFNTLRDEANTIRDFECTMANDMATLLFYKGQQLTGAKLKADMTTLYETGFFEKFIQVVGSGANFRQETEIGEGRDKKHLEISAVKMGDGIVVTCVNNTDKHLSENKLRQNYNELIIAREKLKYLNEGLEKQILSRTKELTDSQERFQLIATATNDALWDWDILHGNMWWNNAFYKQMGYHDKESVKTRMFWYNNIRPEDRDQAMQVINKATSGEEDTWQMEYAFKKANGTYAHILERGYILRDENGTPYRMLGSMFDTSEVRKAVQIAKSSQNKFRKIFDSQLIGMVLFNYNGLIVDTNSSFLNMLGYGRQDLKRKKLHWNELIPPAYQTVSENFFTNLKQNGDNRAVEKQFITKSGKRIDVMVGSAALNDDDEADAVAYIIDISDQKKVSLRQKELESRFSFLADFMPDKIWTFNREGKAEYFNQRWVEYTGMRVKELSGNSWHSVVHPDDLKRTVEVWEECVRSGREYEIEYRLRDNRNIYRWHLSRTLPYRDTNGETVMWIGNSNDIHDQKTFTEALRVSGNNFRQLADQTPFMIWRVDKNGLCTYVNKPWIDFTGISFEESLDIGWSQAVHPDEKELAYKGFMQVFARYEIYKSKVRIRRKDGQYRWVLAQSNPVFDNEFEGYIGSFTDITEQVLAQEATKLLMAKKDEFMSIASHELRTPITTMKASLQLAQRLIDKQSDIESIRSFIDRANNQVSKLAGLVSDLLDVTKIHAGKMQLTTSEFEIGEAIFDSIEQVKTDSESHTISVTGDLAVRIFADKNRLEQVITNFLSNAIKYSPEANSVVVHVQVMGDELKVSVRDYGIGIPGDRAGYVFDRFFRVQESSQKFSGLGLGLYISAEIIQRHGGEVGVNSEEGKGSTFWFRLPLDVPELKMAQNLTHSDSEFIP